MTSGPSVSFSTKCSTATHPGPPKASTNLSRTSPRSHWTLSAPTSNPQQSTFWGNALKCKSKSDSHGTSCSSTQSSTVSSTTRAPTKASKTNWNKSWATCDFTSSRTTWTWPKSCSALDTHLKTKNSTLNPTMSSCKMSTPTSERKRPCMCLRKLILTTRAAFQFWKLKRFCKSTTFLSRRLTRAFLSLLQRKKKKLRLLCESHNKCSKEFTAVSLGCTKSSPKTKWHSKRSSTTLTNKKMENWAKTNSSKWWKNLTKPCQRTKSSKPST